MPTVGVCERVVCGALDRRSAKSSGFRVGLQPAVGREIARYVVHQRADPGCAARDLDNAVLVERIAERVGLGGAAQGGADLLHAIANAKFPVSPF